MSQTPIVTEAAGLESSRLLPRSASVAVAGCAAGVLRTGRDHVLALRPGRGPWLLALGGVAGTVVAVPALAPLRPHVLAVAVVLGALLVLTRVTARPQAVLPAGQVFAGGLRLRHARATQEETPPGPALVDLVTTLSHEIRTPLGAVIGTSELLLAGNLDRTQREQVAQLRHSSMLILGLVNDALDRATLDAGELVVENQPFELSDVLADVVELVQVAADTKHVAVQIEVGPGCPDWVRGDAPRLRQVLTNLLANAVKFTDSGAVTVEVCRAARPEQPEALYFQVTDTGTGIPADQLGALFQPYGRALLTGQPRRGGSGLGLSISQSLVRGMGGEIVVTSRVGVGSVFGFELVLPPEQAPVAVAGSLRGRRVVVVDPHPARAAALADQLRRWGAEVDAQPQTVSWNAGSDLVVVREDHPDALAALGEELRQRRRTTRPALLLLTASRCAVPVEQLAPADVVLGAGTAAARLRSTLTAMLPQADRERPETLAARRPLRVLLAEDDPTSRRVCELLVQRLGHDVDVVGDGAAAVAATAEHAYDVVLMDSQMPGLDGAAATWAIRTGALLRPEVPVIALTGATSAADVASYTAAGMDGVLAKPVDLAALTALFAHVPVPDAVPSLVG